MDRRTMWASSGLPGVNALRGGIPRPVAGSGRLASGHALKCRPRDEDQVAAGEFARLHFVEQHPVCGAGRARAQSRLMMPAPCCGGWRTGNASMVDPLQSFVDPCRFAGTMYELRTGARGNSKGLRAATDTTPTRTARSGCTCCAWCAVTRGVPCAVAMSWPTAGRPDRRRRPGTTLTARSLYEELPFSGYRTTAARRGASIRLRPC